MRNKKICVIAMGGTISFETSDPFSQNYSNKISTIEPLINKIKLPNILIKHRVLGQKISHDITMEDIQNLAIAINMEAKNVDGFVITVGTNAIEDISFAIGLLVNTDVPIIFTGAHYPQNSTCYDGELNLRNSLIVASSDEAKKNRHSSLF